MLSLALSGVRSPLFVVYEESVRSGRGATVLKAGRKRSSSMNMTMWLGRPVITVDVMMPLVLNIAKFDFPSV